MGRGGQPRYLPLTDIAALGWAAGDEIEIARGEDRIAAHCGPGIAERPDEATNALVDPDDGDFQAINRMAVINGIAVTLSRSLPARHRPAAAPL